MPTHILQQRLEPGIPPPPTPKGGGRGSNTHKGPGGGPPLARRSSKRPPKSHTPNITKNNTKRVNTKPVRG